MTGRPALSLTFLASASLDAEPFVMKGSNLLSFAYGICRPFQKQTATELLCSAISYVVSPTAEVGM